MRAFEYSFAAMRGVQAGREYYVTMCPLGIVAGLLQFVRPELHPEMRAQRILNRARIPEIARYLADNPSSYILSSLTASIDGDVIFEPVGSDGTFGRLRIPMQATVLVQDGQHRHAAIIEAIRQRPELADDSVSIVFFVDVGLERSQQMFADLNRYAIRTTSSLGLLYDHRDGNSRIVKEVIRSVPVFSALTEFERSSISNRSTKLFTLSGIHSATQALLNGLSTEEDDQKVTMATEFWGSVAGKIAEWTLAAEGKVNSADLRRDFIHSHALALAALGRVGNSLLTSCSSRERRAAVAKLSTIDWRRSNSAVWEGRAMNAGRLSKRAVNIMLVANYLKSQLGIELSPAELSTERDFKGAKNARATVRR